jgi:hypothetical protein
MYKPQLPVVVENELLFCNVFWFFWRFDKMLKIYTKKKSRGFSKSINMQGICFYSNTLIIRDEKFRLSFLWRFPCSWSDEGLAWRKYSSPKRRENFNSRHDALSAKNWIMIVMLLLVYASAEQPHWSRRLWLENEGTRVKTNPLFDIPRTVHRDIFVLYEQIL